jgi:hypothetical protein
MTAPRVGEQLEVQDPPEGPEQDSGQVAKDFWKNLIYLPASFLRKKYSQTICGEMWTACLDNTGENGRLYELTNQKLLELILGIEGGGLLVEPVALLHNKRAVHAERKT